MSAGKKYATEMTANSTTAKTSGKNFFHVLIVMSYFILIVSQCKDNANRVKCKIKT